MNAPVAWRWNPYGSTPVVDVPAAPRTAAPSYSPSSSYTSPLAYTPTHRSSGVESYQFSAGGVVIIPKALAAEGQGYSERYGEKEGKDPDPRAEVISLAQNVQDIDGLVAKLATQPIDIGAAEQRVTASNDQLVKFLTEVPASFTAEQQGVLEPLRQTALNAQGDNQAPAQLEYFSALEGMLTPEQRANLRRLERNQEDATMDLQGQLIGQRIVDARAGKIPSDPKDPLKGASSAELLSLAQADGRALISKRQLTDIDRKLQDVYELALTPENEAKLEPKRQALHDAQQQLDKDPENPELQQRVKDLTSSLDNAVYALFSPNDHAAVRGFEAHQRHLKGIAGVLGEEATIERKFYEARAINNAGGEGSTTTPALQKQEFQLSQHQFEYVGQTRSLRGVALKLAGAPDDEKLGAQFDQGMVDLMRTQSSLGVESNQFGYDLAVNKHEAWVKANPTAATTDPATGEVQQVSSTSAQAANGATGVSPTLQAVNSSRVALEQAQQQHRDLEDQLKPKEVGFWDRVLEVAGGVLEIVGGVVVMAMAGWTGVGAGLGALLIADGVLRTAHSVTDWANGTQTDAPLSSLLQNFGVDRGLANGIDMGFNFVATLLAGGSGALMMVLKGTTMIKKGAGVLSLLSIGDNGQAVTRSIITREHVQPFTVIWLQGAGLTPTQANYVNAFGGFAGTFGAASVARARAVPGKTHTQFVTYDPANKPAGGTVNASTTRVADYYTRGAKKSDREEMIDALVGPNATKRERKAADKSLRGKPLVVLREVVPQGSNPIVGVAQVHTNATGRLGRDNQGRRIAPHQSEVKLLHATDKEVRAQTLAAGTVGVEMFLPKQQGVFFQTTDAEDASYIADRGSRVETKQRVRREAPALLAALPDVDRPFGTSDAIDVAATGTSSLSRKKQLKEQVKNLSEIPGGERHQWPVGSQDLRFGIDFERPLTALGSERLGKTVHILHEDSYLATLNDRLNPVNLVMNLVKPKSPQVIHTFADRKGGPDRVAVYFPADKLPDPIRAKVVKGVVDANTVLGERVSVNRQEHRYDHFDHKVENLETVVVFDGRSVVTQGRSIVIPDPDQAVVLGAATIKPDFKGFSVKDAPVQYPWMSRRTYKRGTTYLGDVFGTRGGGAQAVVAAAHAARNVHRAHHFDFLTQRNDGAVQLYEDLGTQVHGTGALPKIAVPPKGRKHPVGHTPATEKLTLPTEVYSARFSSDAAQVLMDAPAGTLHPDVQRLVDDAGGSAFVLQTRLEHMDTAEAYSYATTAPSTTVLIRYNADFDVGSLGPLRNRHEQRVDKKRQTRDTTLEPTAFEMLSKGATWSNDFFNPFANAGIQNTPVRQILRDIGHAAQYGFAQTATTGRGVMFNLAGMQLATGQVDVVVDDPRANYPFNFHRDSWNISVVFNLTGTVLTTAVMTPNARGPWPLDPNGLQPLGRGGPALTNPTGPKSVGVMFSGRALAYEANVGVQWFNVKLTEDGPTLSMVSSAGMKFLQAAGNARFDSDGLQAPGSFTILAPSLINAFYYNEYGVTGRSPHVSLLGIAQTAATGGSRNKGLQSGNHWLVGSDGTSTGATGYFLTRNPAWGKDLLTEPKVILGS